MGLAIFPFPRIYLHAEEKKVEAGFFSQQVFSLRIPQAGLTFFALSVKRPGLSFNPVVTPKDPAVGPKGQFLAKNRNYSLGSIISFFPFSSPRNE